MLTFLRNVRVEDIFLEKHASYEFITARYYEPARIPTVQFCTLGSSRVRKRAACSLDTAKRVQITKQVSRGLLND